MKQILFLSFKFLKGRGRKTASTISLISIIGVMLGVMVPIIVLSVMNGFQEEIRNKILGMSGHISIVAPTKLGLTNYQDILDELRSNPAVRGVHPYAEMQGLYQDQLEFEPVLIHALMKEQLGYDPELENLITPIEGKLDIDKPYRIMIGKQMQMRKFLSVGDRITLVLLGKEKLQPDNLSKAKSVRVEIVGIFETGFQEYDNNLIITSLKTLDKLFQTGDAIDSISIKLTDIWESPQEKVALVGKYGDQFLIYTWEELYESFFKALSLEKGLLRLIMLFILVVAIFNVMSGQLIQISEHKREIGILKTIGYAPWQILSIFLSSGLIVTSLGAITGAILGSVISYELSVFVNLLETFVNALLTLKDFFFSFFTNTVSQPFEIFPKNVYYLDQIPSDFSILRAIYFIGLAIFFTLIAGIIPSYKAAKIKAMEVMRYE